jgi:hypothetical protein
MLGLADQLLAAPSKLLAEQFSQCVLNFTDWEKPPEGWPARFMEDSEWTWRKGWAPWPIANPPPPAFGGQAGR